MKLLNGQEYKPEKYEFGLSVIDEHFDTNCFYFNTSDASFYLKCKLPLSILNQNQHAKPKNKPPKLISLGSTIPRVLNLRVEDKESGAVAHNVLFEIKVS